MKRTELAPDARRRRYSKWTHLILGAAIGLSLGTTPAGATPNSYPAGPTDQTKVPHYFGPFPNWALSPLTLPDADVAIADAPEGGKTATATATVGAGGVLTGFVITDPGRGYTSPTAGVTITSVAGTGAGATAHVTLSGAVTGIAVAGTPVSSAGWGSGYSAPIATITGGAGSGAAATVYGGVDAVTLNSGGGGQGYTFPVVNFDLPDGADGVAAQAYALCDGAINCPVGGSGVITGIVVTQPGSGYSSAPAVTITNGTLYDPINMTNGGSIAAATATLAVQTVAVTNGGSNYAPTVENPIVVTISGGGSGATATAGTDYGTVSSITLNSAGSGYLTAGGIKKFQDTLPGLCDPTADSGSPLYCGTGGKARNNLGQFLPIGIPNQTVFTTGNGFTANSDYYQIALIQHRECMSSSLGCANDHTKGTLLREYVQLVFPRGETCTGVELSTDLLDGSSVALYLPDGTRACGVTQPHYLGPIILATKDKAVRFTFYNLLPTGSGGDLIVPTDSTLMGAGFGPLTNWPTPTDIPSVMDGVRNPECTQDTKGTDPKCFRDNRATVHLHGATSPWISDGTPHQWITPKNEGTAWPEGESVGNVPDMTGETPTHVTLESLGVPDCSGTADGCQTFYYTNQQSARLLFYHDHASATTRLNVYLGEAAGYLIGDPTETSLMNNGIIPGLLDEIPLIIQDRTFVPSPTQISEQDPTWDADRWGGQGNFWYHHVYMPAQNPGDPSGMSAYGRWMYGPWFWPPATPPNGPIPNPYYQMDPKATPPFSAALAADKQCNLNDPDTWQYDTDPFCEPEFIPGTPNISAGMEQFNDTPLVNGTAYPTLTVEPKTYRFRVLNAANDRFWNLSLYQADSTGTEVAFNASELAAAQTDPNIVPTPDTSKSPPGPSWIVIGSEGGFLPAPTVVPPQPTTWIIDPTRFDVGNVDLHSLLLGPAERADVIVDFSEYAGKDLILYNDAPAAFPARVATYDYYTGTPDLSPNGASAILPGYGPNTRTIMLIKVRGEKAQAFNLNRLKTAFQHNAHGTGVFESGQLPIIVGQAAYNSAYGTNFVGSGDCNSPPATDPRFSSPKAKCDGFMRIDNQGGTWFGFNTLRTGTTSKLQLGIQPKAMHDEMNSAAFDEFGRMTANLGLEATPASPNGQTITLLPYINPQTELWDGTKLPAANARVTPIASADDGTQIWRITHNGVDTHPIHFHLYDVQVLNRVTWDNIIIPPDPTELGWKDTIRVSPLEDTIVAIRPVIPQLPFEIPNSIRALNPATAFTGADATMGFNPIAMDPVTGQPVAAPITNQLVNFGWEYVWHCHILSHEEMDMMRPQSLVLPPIAPTWNGAGYAFTGAAGSRHVVLTWNDKSITETSFLVQSSADDGAHWTDVPSTTGAPNPILSPLELTNTHQVRSFTDPRVYEASATDRYRVVANNTVGYGGAYPSLTASSVSPALLIPPAVLTAPNPPSEASAAWTSGTTNTVSFTDNSDDETAFLLERSNGVAWTTVPGCGAVTGIGPRTCTDPTVTVTNDSQYRIAAVKGGVSSASVITNWVPAAPGNVTASALRVGNAERVTLSWTDNSAQETGFRIQRATNAGFTAGVSTTTVQTPNAITYTTGNLSRQPYWFRVQAYNAATSSAWVTAAPAPLPSP